MIVLLRGIALVIVIIAAVFFIVGAFGNVVNLKDYGIGLAGVAITLALWILSTIIADRPVVTQ